MERFRPHVLIGTVGLALIAACGDSPPPLDSVIAKAKEYQQKGDQQAAIVELRNVLQRDPQHGEARFLVGMSFKQSGEPRGAEHHFREALKANYDPKRVLPLLAQALFEQDEFEKVLDTTRTSDFGEAAQQPEVLALRGHSQVSLGRAEDAAKSFQEALSRRPEFAPALLGEVRLAMLNRDAAAARALVARALAADPSSVDAWLLRGDLDRAESFNEAAIAAYEKALALNPKGVAANLNLASMYLAAENLDQARKRVEIILQVAPDSPIGNYLLALLEFHGNNLAAANVAVKKVQKALPNHLPAMALAGLIAYATGANEEADKLLRDAVERAPGSAYLRRAHATVLLKRGRARDAIQVLEPALKAAPNDPSILVLFAEAKLQNKEPAAARKYFELAAIGSPKDARVRSGLGMARLAAGDTERALADLEVAAGLGDETADTFLVRGLLSMRQYDKALAAVSRLEEKRPRDPVIFNLKGAALFGKGDVAGARKAFEQALAIQPRHIAATTNLAQLDARDKNPVEARSRFERILQADKDDVPAMLALVDLASANNNRAEALRWAQRAKIAQPKAFAPSMTLGRLHFAQGDYANASTSARDALAVRPDDAEALNILGYSQLRLGQRSQALETYRTLVTRYPSSAEAHYGLSGALSDDGQLTAAERGLAKALSLRPDFPEALYALAALQLRMGKVADARKIVNDAQKRLPKSALGAVIEGDAAMAEKRYDHAVRAYEAAFAIEKSRALLIKLHGALQDAGKATAADALAADWLNRNPNDVRVRYVVADAAIRNQNYRLAAEQYQLVLKSEPTKLAVLHNLGWVYERMNDPRALDVAETAYKIAPNDPGVLHNLGRLLVDAGKANRAIELLGEARMRAPDSQLVRYHLARAYSKSGDNARARAELEQLLRGKQDFADRAAAVALLKQLRD